MSNKALNIELKLLSLGVLSLGIVNLAAAIKIDSYLAENPNKCTNSDLRRSNSALLVTSSFLVALSLSYLTCSYSCDKGSNSLFARIFAKYNPYTYGVLISCISVVLLVYGSIIYDKSKNCESIKHSVGIVFGSSLISLIIALLMILLMYLNKNKKKD